MPRALPDGGSPAGLLALLLVLGGCSGVGVGPSPDPTVTPAPLPTDSPSPADGPFGAPGISGTHVTNATALAQAHAQVLSATSFTRHTTLQIQYPNGTVLLGATVTLRMGPTDDRFRYHEARTGAWADEPDEPVTVTVWSEGDSARRAIKLGNGTVLNTTLARDEATIGRAIGRPSGDRIASLFGNVRVEVVGRSQANGTAEVEVVASDVPPTLVPVFPAPHGEATVRATVSETGLVRSVLVTSESRRGEHTLQLQWCVRYFAIGQTTVAPSLNEPPMQPSTTGC